ncbi:glycerol-3-phosphate 1-O-acyltransferase PlsY [Lachnospiraceae bacterium NSJ-143]|nr:glycerol-3-phosphate 1-O-acyltransferase PlsY [Lachnospiraceae bacterium NSJ-143]
MFRIFCVLIGYAVGCFQSAYFVGAIMKKDIRKYGSGNLGSTNALRVLGKKAGAATFVCDVGKGIIAFAVCYHFFGGLVAGIYASFGVMLGHDFPFYLKFKGGKGIASSIGMDLCLMIFFNPIVTAVSFICGFIGLGIKGYVSMGSLFLISSVPVMCFVLSAPIEVTLITLIMAVVALVKHRANISRILSGSENALFVRK